MKPKITNKNKRKMEHTETRFKDSPRERARAKKDAEVYSLTLEMLQQNKTWTDIQQRIAQEFEIFSYTAMRNALRRHEQRNGIKPSIVRTQDEYTADRRKAKQEGGAL